LKSTKVKGPQLMFEGDQYFREGDCHAAQAHYKAAFEEDQKNARAAVKAAQCLWKMSLSTEAIEWLNRAIKADPKLMEAYVTLAEYQAGRYNFQAAARVLEEGRRVNPKSYEVFRGFAIVELKRGNPKGAVQFGKQALKLYENDVDTQILMAEASLAMKDYAMAFNYAAKAIEIDVNNRKAQIIYAKALAAQRGPDVGADYLVKLVGNYSQVSEYRLALGQMYLADERYAQAEEIFRQIIKLDEKPKEAYVELAKALRAEGNMSEALDLLFKAAVLDPADAQPLFLAGCIYLDIKRPREAMVQFQRVLTINKMFPLVHYQLGRAAMQMGDAKEALNQTDEEKRANPNMAEAYLLAAEAHTQLQQYSNCATEYQHAIKLRPQQATIYVKVAQCYRKKGDLDAATAMLNVASTKESGLADIYKEQGAIYEMRSDVNRAIDAYRQYFVLDPDATDRPQIEARINALQRGQTP
jgi:tetratricopeptide (TPR) repeat protein